MRNRRGLLDVLAAPTGGRRVRGLQREGPGEPLPEDARGLGRFQGPELPRRPEGDGAPEHAAAVLTTSAEGTQVSCQLARACEGLDGAVAPPVPGLR